MEKEIIRNIRFIIGTTIQKANSGHPGAAISLTPLFHVLYGKIAKVHKDFQSSEHRDIVIMSNGHACTVQYTMLALMDFITMEDLKNFRQIGSLTPGHPEISTPGIEASTGPLGQGLGNSVGYAISLKKIGSNAKVYVVFGDGCYQEGISHEAFALAANLNLNNINFIYDSNQITIDGSTDLSMNEDPKKRFESFGFEIESCDGEDAEKIQKILQSEQSKPRVLILHTKIAEGCSKVGSFKTHGAPLGQSVVDEYRQDDEDFTFHEESLKFYKARMNENLAFFQNKKISTMTYKAKCDESKGSSRKIFTEYTKTFEKKATRELIPEILDKMRSFNLPFIGGSGDLTPSTLTRMKIEDDFTRDNPNGTYLRFGIREHGMCAILNGITAHGFYRSFGSTFLGFITYSFPSVRLAALGHIPNVYLLTHDSIGLGEDGPTHQPVEVLPLLRSTPNIYTFRPCDALETRFAIWFSLTQFESPTVVCFTRQKIPEIEQTCAEGVQKGAYFLIKEEKPDVTIFASGSEVHIALETANLLKQKNKKTSVVSIPSFELFEKQDEKYKREILNSNYRVSIEASSTFGWSKYVDYSFGLTTFGLSAPADKIYKHFGLDSITISDKISELIDEKAL